MKTSHVIRDALKALEDGNRLFSCGNYEGAVQNYGKALTISKSLPPNAEFEHPSFEASCQAGLSAAYGRLGKHLESFTAANKALLFYDAYGEKYPALTGSWLKVIVNQGVALAHLGVFEEALRSLERAKHLFTTKCLPDTPENKQWLAVVEENIAALSSFREDPAISYTATLTLTW
jgi:tetratricopeptide (TPR) repeat protein